mgnify:CR=1 FL=1
MMRGRSAVRSSGVDVIWPQADTSGPASTRTSGTRRQSSRWRIPTGTQLGYSKDIASPFEGVGSEPRDVLPEDRARGSRSF